MRICSFLPSATEMLFALGLEDSLVGVTYACDTPEAARAKPVVVRTRLPETRSSAELDAAVKDFLRREESLYSVDEKLLAELQPDLIITQDLCYVCAASPDDLPAALSRMEKEPKVLTLAPKTLGEVWTDLLTLGEATRCLGPAGDLVSRIKNRLRTLQTTLADVPSRPRVACLEWLNPPFVAGHWVPDMVAEAGGEDALGKASTPSFEVTWDEILAARPDVIVICPCGLDLEETLEEVRATEFPRGWSDVPAVRQGRVYAVDANSFFSRPSHRLVTGVEILAGLLHPERAEGLIPEGSCKKLT